MVPYLLPAKDRVAWRTMGAAVALLIGEKVLNVQV